MRLLLNSILAIFLLTFSECSLVYNRFIIPVCACNLQYYQNIFQSIASIKREEDGTGNNLKYPQRGKNNMKLKRIAPSVSNNFCSMQVENQRPSARLISNLVCSLENQNIQNDPRNLSGIFLVWGQFLTHDLHHTPPQEGTDKEQCPIKVPLGDKYFDRQNTGKETLEFVRSIYDKDSQNSSIRQQINLLNPWFDGQPIYGSDKKAADELRLFQDGKIKLSSEQLLTKKGNTFISGDIRVNENIVLTAINTIFARQHNRVCDYFLRLSKVFGKYSDEEKYIFAKNYVSALIAKITYDDYLPLLLGQENNLDSYQGYDQQIDPSITNIFATAAFRFGHFTIPQFVKKIDSKGVQEKIKVRDAVRNSDLIKNKKDIGYILKGESKNVIKQRDVRVTDEMRNFLVATPNRKFLLDLAALNIQRGRDHGFPDYNTFRKYLGLVPLNSFEELTSDERMLRKLIQCYQDVNQIDPFIGLMAEKSLPNAQIGELGAAIIRDTMSRVRAGDRLWYENSFPQSMIKSIKSTTLSDIIKRNTYMGGLSDNVFVVS